MSTTLDLYAMMKPDHMARDIANTWTSWKQARAKWESSVKEVRDYVFATDTSGTTNAKLPWKNSTVRPKLCQIRDNLHANYMAALFPHNDWFKWEAGSSDDATLEKIDVIEGYMATKLSDSDFQTEVSELVYDYIDYGNVFATVEWVDDFYMDEVTGQKVQKYLGPKLVRINPFDIVFNPLASSFEKTPKIRRILMTLGELKRMAEEKPLDDASQKLFKNTVKKAIRQRKTFQAMSCDQTEIDHRLSFDGFGTTLDYFNSDVVEILEFHGDMYDVEKDTLYKNSIIRVIDRAYVLEIINNPSWLYGQIKHAGWRLRQDNLYAMGPLENLVGMQYRIDHLENLKADVFDMIAHPAFKKKGDTVDSDFIYKPGAIFDCGDNGDIVPMVPDTTALNADLQIRELEDQMEELAGAPKQAMGFRTPGEKTAFEVQSLENAASRIFQNKIGYFEKKVIEPILNLMLEISRRNLDVEDVFRSVGEDSNGYNIFLSVTKEDLQGLGRLRARGASHFGRQNQVLQNLMSLVNSGLFNDPMVRNNFDSMAMARLVEDLLQFRKFELVKKNVLIDEQVELEQKKSAAQETLDQGFKANGGTPLNLPV